MSECRACQYTSEIHKEAIEKELERLKEMKNIKLASEDEVNRRLALCEQCKFLDFNNVCSMCGCYVQIRTLLKDSHCAAKNKLW